ncbi:hypothetical protein [Moheibacter lacus]|uniref:Uncharacterized protein n=1 Tax=Moheibacter lacus TaxID=2745851 RepID=A0A838ZU94_9FLAO|nr:hypothetical protein [Moheibacter lacus]MBA5630575.1 hypothetical protein [Moheibacter lacus]
MFNNGFSHGLQIRAIGKAINQMPTAATQNAATIMVNTPYSIVEQGLNQRYGGQ